MEVFAVLSHASSVLCQYAQCQQNMVISLALLQDRCRGTWRRNPTSPSTSALVGIILGGWDIAFQGLA